MFHKQPIGRPLATLSTVHPPCLVHMGSLNTYNSLPGKSTRTMSLPPALSVIPAFDAL